MAETTAIRWTDHTFNPWMGCTKISPACDRCYAEAMTKRMKQVEWGPHADRRRTSALNWKEPVKWNKRASRTKTRARVFCASLADVFDNHASIQDEWRTDLWALIRATPWLDWLLLTKRPEKIQAYLPADWGTAGYQNVWLGTTVEDQTRADHRVPLLLSIPASVHFLSCEPLLGPLELSRWLGPDQINWAIVGGESGPGARPMEPAWAQSIRDQATAAGTAFFFKQWGQHAPTEEGMKRFRKVEDAGWALDGREYAEWPQPKRRRGRPAKGAKAMTDVERAAAYRDRAVARLFSPDELAALNQAIEVLGHLSKENSGRAKAIRHAVAKALRG